MINMNCSSSNPLLNDSDLIDLELRCSGQSDIFLDDLDFILDEDGGADGEEVGILASSSSRRRSKSQESVAMDIQEFDGWNNDRFDADDTIQIMSYGINPCHISRLCQSDTYDFDLAPIEQRCFQPSAMEAQFNEVKYNEALQKLAESMQRTETTRRQVMLQRQILMPTQQIPQQASCPSPEQVESEHSISQGRSFILNAFFSGSRCTLTNGLDHSRKQLSMYMTQMNQQTL